MVSRLTSGRYSERRPATARTTIPPASSETVARAERTALEQPLRGGAGTVEKPVAGRLVGSAGAAGQGAGGGAGAQPRPGGAADAENEVANVVARPAPKSTDNEVDGLRTRVKDADQAHSVKQKVRKNSKHD